MAHEFELGKEIELDATPEQVWEAIATGPGVDSWFMGRTEIEPGEGGRGSFTMLGGTETTTVTAWEPGKRFAFRSDDGPDGTFMAMEYLIEGRDGGSTVLRLVQHGFLGDDWETEYEAMATGWDLYLHKLSRYLTHFRGRPVTVVSAVRPHAPERPDAWAAVKAELGLTGTVREGDPVRLAVDGLRPQDGVVDYAALPDFLGVRTADGLYGFIHSGPKRGNVMVLGHHVFAEDIGQEQAEGAWRSWLARVFP
ncbi:SRPBCC domain-containing protein [Microbispora sp. H11081]|uniref:SRPBCC family protein n=1 Tax=Microbispora sp. H11081 TaxID=2729107 RepID=UPI0014749BA7|nr:SRPBCC domain-containing protein [Microbispora sp. H11081]